MRTLNTGLWAAAVALLALQPAPAIAQTEPPSAGSAALRSLGATLVPMALGIEVARTGGGGAATTVVFATLFWGGALVGPATGYWYAGLHRRGNLGVIVRAITFVAASIVSPTDDLNDGIYPNPDFSEPPWWGAAVVIIAVSIVADLVSVGPLVTESNTRVTPIIDPRAQRAGLALRVAW